MTDAPLHIPCSEADQLFTAVEQAVIPWGHAVPFLKFAVKIAVIFVSHSVYNIVHRQRCVTEQLNRFVHALALKQLFEIKTGAALDQAA